MPLQLEPLNLPNWPFASPGIVFGQGRQQQLEVIYSEANRAPKPAQLRSAWKKRQDGRAVPLLVVVLHGGKAHLCGPSGEDPTVYPHLDPGQVERLCQEALEQPSRQAALRALRDSLASVEEDGLPGLRNEGFLASHELRHGVPTRAEWSRATVQARGSLGRSGSELLTALGYTTAPLDKIATILKTGDHKTALAILLNERETPEAGSERIHGNLSPVSYALARAEEENLDWVMLLHGSKIRLYPVELGVGVGRRGRTETYLECHTRLLPDSQAAYLWLLFSAEALAQNGTLESILADSTDFAGDLATQLRERIYDEVVPGLAMGLVDARRLRKPTAQNLAGTYQMAMVVLFRVLFTAYGEDKDLLPYRSNGLYQTRSLKAKAKELQALSTTGREFGETDGLWQEVQAIFRAIDKGNPSWGVPAYNGGLFSSDAEESPIGAELAGLSLPDSVFGPVLQYLLLVPTREAELGPVDFRSLGVREFGTIYEGLLEAELSVAETDLTVEARGKNQGAYRPCQKGEDPTVPKGRVYLHNTSGARKSTGSYYTKTFAVEHLLDRALEPALTEHFARLDALGDDLKAAEAFFDFRVADIAMGSGHFLVAAADRIEARFSVYLANRPLPQIAKELDQLREAALAALGDAAEAYPDLEDNALLRRLIARRCIYGVDLNPVAVQLARLGLWIHTFVPGLPLSWLDRNLIRGNSLVGVGRLSEITDELADDLPLLPLDTETFLCDAEDALGRLGRLSDATKADLQAARTAWTEAESAIAPTKALCDILTASRIEGERFPINLDAWNEDRESVVNSKRHKHALHVLKGMRVLHFPVAFPEVFLRQRAGFDVILGNPPWEEAMADEDAFWARHFPGLRALSARNKKRAIEKLSQERPDLTAALAAEVTDTAVTRTVLSRGPFPGMGTGDVDLYKAFCWRFWFLIAETGGRIGVVMPRSALMAKGSEEFRWKIFKKAKGVDATLLLNNRNWFFEAVHPQYTIGLVVIEREELRTDGGTVHFEGPYNSRSSYDSRSENSGVSFPSQEVLTWNDSACLPLLPSDESGPVFEQLRKAPRLDLNEAGQWRARAYSELHATNDKSLMDLNSEVCPKGFLRVYKGSSFDIWEPDTGDYYAWVDPEVLAPILQKKRSRAGGNRKSAFSEFDSDWLSNPETLPFRQPRVAFRTIARATDSRTVRVSLIPPQTLITNHGPYFLWPRGDKLDECFLLGVLSSIPLDWYARRFVEVNLNFFIIAPFPIPRPNSDNPLRQRVIELAGRLASPDDRFSDWATEVGAQCGPLEDYEKQDMIHELDAVVAHLYGLSKTQLIHIFETFHVGWDYHARLEATLTHYDTWKAKA